MKKQIVRCDKCNEILDETATEENCAYYEVRRGFINGWASIDRTFGALTTWQICTKCWKDFMKKS